LLTRIKAQPGKESIHSPEGGRLISQRNKWRSNFISIVDGETLTELCYNQMAKKRQLGEK
jgi:hypothetical protein